MNGWRVGLVLGLLAVKAWANLSVAPTSIILTDKTRHAFLSLRHRENKPQRYKVTTVYYQMLPDGGLRPVEPKPADHSLHRFLRFSPRLVTVAPNGEQMVRVMITPPANLEDGDYRTHVHFEPLAEDDGTSDNKETKKGIGVQIKARLSIAVPVFYRKGKVEDKIGLAELRLVTKDNAPAFAAMMTKESKSFPYGNLRLTFTPKDGAPHLVRDYLGVGMYTEKRTLVFNLPEEEKKLTGGTLRLEYILPGPDGKADQERLLASTEATLP